MERKPFRVIVLFTIAVAASAAIISCQKITEFDPPDPGSNALERSATSQSNAAIVIGGNEHPGRLLASNCFQCHGTNGYGYEHLAGKSANEIIEEMNEMRSGSAGENIMNVHARGYTTEQVRLIGDFFSRQ